MNRVDAKMSGSLGVDPQHAGDAHFRGRKQTSRTTRKPTVGDTDVAAMCVGAIGSRSASSLVAVICAHSARNVRFLRPDTVNILESLIWPIACHRLQREIPFTDKEWRRCLRSFRRTALTLCKYESEDNREQSFTKYWLDVFMCRVFRDRNFPVKEAWIEDNLFVGWLAQIVKVRILHQDVGFVYSLAKGSKRAWPELGQVKKDLALAKHMQRVQREPTPLDPDLFTAISETSREIFKDLPDKPDQKFMPSGSACLQASRREGGSLSLYEPLELPRRVVAEQDVGTHVKMGLHVLQRELKDWRDSQYQESVLHACDSFSKGTATDVEVVAIPEPGKFRIITKGDGYLYTALQPLQGAMLDCWKRSPFSTMLHDDLTEKVREMDAEVQECPFFVSVDYEAATDLLQRSATFAALPENSVFGELARSSFAVGKVWYPNGQHVRGVNAQFMGHPLSFPLLCVINLSCLRLAATRWFMEAPDPVRSRTVGRILSHVLVNGDDMLFKAPDRRFIEIFKETALQAGLQESVGKNYVSTSCCMINSQVFRKVGGVVKRIGYLNQKFICGVSLKDGNSLASPVELGKEVGKMIELYPPAAACLPAVFSRFKGDWSMRRVQPNWYLPVHLGGYGVPLGLAPDTWTVSRQQRKLARLFVIKPELQLYRRSGGDSHLARFAGSLAKFRLVPGQVAEEDFIDSDEWLTRIAYASRAQFGLHLVSDRVFQFRFLKEKESVRPMSDAELSKWYFASFRALAVPECPPMPKLQFFIPPLESAPGRFNRLY